MEAIVLAGGLGTRLQSVVSDVPKPMAPVGNKPFLEYILRYLQTNGITRVVLSVGYKWETIKEYFGNSFENIELIYSAEEEPLGTGGAIKKALKQCREKEIYIINGDTFFDVKLADLKLQPNSKLTLSLKPMKNFDRYGCVEVDMQGYVTSFTEKEFRKVGNINGGIYLLRKNIFDGYNLEDKFSFEEFMQVNFNQISIFSLIFDNYFIDIGIPQDYAKAQKDLVHVKNKALFLDRDGVVNKEKSYLHKIEDFEFLDGVFETCRAFQAKSYLIIIITNQAGIARGKYTEKDYQTLTTWMINEFKKQGITITRTYHCPHHPEYSGECECRKPKPKMILDAQKEFDIDLSKSILVGDKNSDIEAGIKAGVGMNYLIETGHEIKENKFEMEILKNIKTLQEIEFFNV